MHKVGESHTFEQRLELNPKTYIEDPITFLLEEKLISAHLQDKLHAVAEDILNQAHKAFEKLSCLRIHGDCHVGNVLYLNQLYSFIDFDDSLVGPAIQDVWLLLPGRVKDCPRELEALAKGYSRLMRDFPFEELGLIETLRAMRMIYFAAWIGRRINDPAFQRQFFKFCFGKVLVHTYCRSLRTKRFYRREINMKHIIITGANRGIGLALTKKFLADKNNKIFATYRSKKGSEELLEMSKELGERLKVFELDVTDPNSLTAFAKDSHLPIDIDILINNAVSFGRR